MIAGDEKQQHDALLDILNKATDLCTDCIKLADKAEKAGLLDVAVFWMERAESLRSFLEGQIRGESLRDFLNNQTKKESNNQ